VNAERVVRWALCLLLTVPLCSCSREDAAAVKGEKPASPIPAAPPPAPLRGESLTGGNGGAVKSKRAVDVTDVDERTDLAPADRETLKTVEKAMEDENYKILRAVVPAAIKSPSAEVRSETVDALGWFGEKTMDDLLPFMADADEDIAASALNHWTSALGDIEDDKRKCALVENVMQVLKNEDALESLVTELNNCEDLLALRSVVKLIHCDNPAAVKVAREHYEFMTGEAFTTMDAANAWAEENCSDKEED